MCVSEGLKCMQKHLCVPSWNNARVQISCESGNFLCVKCDFEGVYCSMFTQVRQPVIGVVGETE